MYLPCPFDPRLGEANEVGMEQRLGRGEAGVLLSHGYNDGGAVLARVVNHAHRVGEAGCDVDVDDGGSVSGAGVAVRHREGHRLVEAENVLELRVVLQAVHEGELGRSRVAEDVLRILGEELLHDGVLTQD